jgi:ElaB/YqjD/DUF883 family membrane-anchored ribosome-binding protein
MRKKKPSMEDSAARLSDDFRQVISDAEALLRATAGEAGESVEAARAKVQDSLEAAKSRLGSLGEDYAEQMRAVDGYVRGNPWQAVGIAALAGIALGLLITRR